MKTYSSSEIIQILKEEGLEINKRTFTYYASEKKILPEPILINNKPKYTDSHIQYLKAILILKDKGNTLLQIKEQLDKLNEDEINLISHVYKPFNSLQIIEDAQNIYSSSSYQSLVNNNDLNLFDNSINSFSSLTNSTNMSMSLETQGLSSSYNAPPMNMLNSYQSNQNTASATEKSLPNAMYKTTTQNTNKRTIVNENIILETKNVSDKCLQEIINEIDNIYNKYQGD